MERIVDLHVHSHYSRATSKDCTLEGLYKWGKIKGIHIIGTGDFTHPGWLAELKEKLVPAESGLFRLRDDIAQSIDVSLPASIQRNSIRFILTVEISTIYTKKGSVRKIHSLVVMPDFASVDALNAKLATIGNLRADGRPILGMDCKELLKASLDINASSLFIPAHIWTPWFGMFGSKSGFNSLEEAFDELTPEIKAIETGLSSDPYMNWRIPDLKNISITSHSDAHSPPKLGREATVVTSELGYEDIIGAIRTNDHRLVGTIEFFPAEGKYHYDGHRVCGVRFSPQETRKLKGICPVCHRPLTVGVDFRIGELADKPEHFKPAKHKKVEYIIPLIEIVAEIVGKGTASKAVQGEYEKIYSTLGDEFSILRTLPLSQIQDNGFSQLALAIEKMRKGDVRIEPGYDGIYGKIKLFTNDEERQQLNEQMNLL